jgi:adhesin HecA-like repeat protein
MDLRATELSNSGVIYGRDRSQLRTTTLDNAGVIAAVMARLTCAPTRCTTALAATCPVRSRCSWMR